MAKIETFITRRGNLGNRIDDAKDKQLRIELIQKHAALSKRINEMNGIDYSRHRYDPVLSPNINQYFIYDDYLDAYIDPPKQVLDELDKVREEVGWFDYDAAESWLSALCNDQRPEWLNDTDYTYYGEINL